MFNMKANDMFHTPSSEKELIDHIEDIAKASGNPGAVWAVAMMVNNFLASRQVKEVEQLQPSCRMYKTAYELDETALGNSYYGNSLYVALDMPVVDEDDKRMLHRYLHGSELLTDRIKLQELAIKIRNSGEQNV